MNFVFISPAFPTNYWHFCEELHRNGVNVLGIAETPYNELTDELKNSLTEYYRVNSLENYDEVLRACGYFTHRYGKIDWLESNNEYWLEQDAALRTDFNITSGFRTWDLDSVKLKSGMKAFYEKAGVPTARWHLLSTREEDMEFIRKVGYPVIVKPDRGVGATDTRKISNDEELEFFYEHRNPISYIMEEFVKGQICSYDGIFNSKGEPLLETGNISPIDIMNIVNTQSDMYFYIVKGLADDLRDAGRRCIKAFDVKSRFIHFEFFRLTEDKEGLGRKGDIVGLETNMRPSGGFTPDMINYACSTNVYKMWADMVAFDRSTQADYPEKYYAVFIGLRDNIPYIHSKEDIFREYGANVMMSERMPEILATDMGNQMYIARFSTKEEMDAFVKYAMAV